MPKSLLQNERKMTDAAATDSEKKIRVQLDFESADMQIINDLVNELELGTRAELFRSGLRALRWMVQKRKQRCVVTAITPDGRYLEPEFDFLHRLPVAHLPVLRNESQEDAREHRLEETVHV